MRSRVFSIVPTWVKNAVTIYKKDRSGVLFYGENNRLPNELVDDINASGTAKSCIIRLDQFTQADGFIDESVAASKANPKQTFDDLLAELSMNIVYSKSVCFRVSYNNEGLPARIYSIPFTELRRMNGAFVWNENFGNRNYRSQEDKILFEFDPEERPELRLERINKQIKDHKRQLGDLVYFYKKSMASPHYPIPDYCSETAINDIRSDTALSKIDNTNITKGFRTPVIISTGPVDEVNTDEHGKSEQDYLDENLVKFVGVDAPPILHLKANSPEEMAKVTVIPIADIVNATDATRDRISKSICRHFNVPPPLIGIATPGELGNNQQLVNQIKLMNLSVNNNQRMIANALSYVLPGKDFTISTLKLFEVLPPEIFNILTEEEKRELYELTPRPNETTEAGI